MMIQSAVIATVKDACSTKTRKWRQIPYNPCGFIPWNSSSIRAYGFNYLQCLFSNHTGIHQCLFLHLIARVHINCSRPKISLRHKGLLFVTLEAPLKLSYVPFNLTTSALHIKQYISGVRDKPEERRWAVYKIKCCDFHTA